MAELKKQHYVHQGYLKLFFDKIDTIWVFNRKINKVYSKSFGAICDIACIKNFYDINLDNQDSKKYEKFFGTKLEPKFTKILKRVKNTEALNANMQADCAIFLAFQILRTPRFRNWLIKIRKETIKDILDRHLSNSLPPELLKDYNKDYINIDFNESHLHIQQLLPNIIQLAENLILLDWEIIINKTELDFITSSEPVYTNGGEHTGIRKYNTFLFNLTPKICIRLKQNLGDKVKIEKIEINNKGKISDINKKIAQRSECVYVTNRKQAERLRKTLPKYKDIETIITEKDNRVLYSSKF